MWQTNSRNLQWSPWAVLLVAGLAFAGWACPSEPQFQGQNTDEPALDAGDDATDDVDDVDDANDVDDGEPDAVEDACEPTSDEELCEGLDDECGIVENVDDGCEERSVDCGECDGERAECFDDHEPNLCRCDSFQCADLDSDLECGSHDDGCGGKIHCEGSCDAERETCLEQSDGTYECIVEDECEPEFKEQDCDTHCGEVADGCGDTVDCGDCQTEQEVCTDDNECCLPDTDDAFCTDHGVRCGELTAEDNCGKERTVDCDRCATDLVCTGGQCIPDTGI